MKERATMNLAQWDYQVFQLINSLAGKLTYLNPLMRLLSEDGEYLFYAGVIVYWFTRIYENRRMVFEALFSACVAFSISGLIGLFYYRDRPFVVYQVLQMIKHAANASFPSDHAIGAFVIATSIYLFKKKHGYAWLSLATMIAFSRVWNGVHYPLDVIVGALIGIFCSLVVHKFLVQSTFAQRWVQKVIHYYEKWEQKVWAKS
jgi:undecaprenyl-diphosphatase